MSYADRSNPSYDCNATGLEDHLRNLILKNSPSTPGSFRQKQLAVSHAATASSDHSFIPPPPGFRPTAFHLPGQPIQMPNNGISSSQHKAAGENSPSQTQKFPMSSQNPMPLYMHPTPQSPRYRASDNGHGQSHRDSHYSSYQQTIPHPRGNTNHFRPGQGSWVGGSSFPPHENSFPQNRYQHHDGRRQHSFRNDHRDNRSRHTPTMSQGFHRQTTTNEDIITQSALLEQLCFVSLASSEIDRAEIAQKEDFRQTIEAICRRVITEYEWNSQGNLELPASSVELKCFGSLSSGFATKASDMDLGLVSPFSGSQPDAPGSPIPRMIEKAFLDAGIGARLLSRTRVPIIKLCEKPPEKLFNDLLAQREKWESGLDQEQNEFNDEDEQPTEHLLDNKKDDDTGQLYDADQIDDADQMDDEAPSNPNSFQLQDADGQWQSYHLRQAPKQNLTAYYGLTKRLLRKVGGRDVTMSNIREFTTRDWDVLNSVCKAFVRGLLDENLRKNLANYPSLEFDSDSNSPKNRSLLGVSLQVEGEQILQLWQKWSIAADLLTLDPSINLSIGFWYDIQRKPNFGQDPIAFNKEVQLALEKIKKLPSFQLLLLEQGPKESAAQYYHRARNITKFIVTKNIKAPENISTDAIQREIINKYITGIYQDDIRKDMKSWHLSSENWDLDAVGFKHGSLNLSAELERALKKNLYEKEQQEDAERYVKILRGPFQERTTALGKRTFFIQIDENMAQLVSRIKALPDPRKLAPTNWRDKFYDPLEFPKDGAGVQCDINFSAHLALQNTLLLRCYSHTDPRVRAMVLFIKHWAKLRGINSGYRGTLSSYGYVLMVLHYLVNVASPFVCPNLQLVAAAGPVEEPQMCQGYNVKFWRNEAEILHLGRSGQISQNQQTLGYLLRGFFEYFAQSGALSTVPGRGFDWGRDVLSLRTRGGLLTKQEKGWTGAKTVFQAQDPKEPSMVKPRAAATDSPRNGKAQAQNTPTIRKATAMKEVRLRFLFAIEDPFELEHNVARTVTHNGIVSIRDEFRRAWRIIQGSNRGLPYQSLLQDVNLAEEDRNPFTQLIDDIHGL